MLGAYVAILSCLVLVLSNCLNFGFDSHPTQIQLLNCFATAVCVMSLGTGSSVAIHPPAYSPNLGSTDLEKAAWYVLDRKTFGA